MPIQKEDIKHKLPFLYAHKQDEIASLSNTKKNDKKYNIIIFDLPIYNYDIKSIVSKFAKKYPLSPALKKLKNTAEKTIAKGIFLPFVLILKGNIKVRFT